MTLQDYAKQHGIQWKAVERDLTEIIKSHDREAEPLYRNRLYGLRAGRLKARAHELRAVLEYTGNEVQGFKD